MVLVLRLVAGSDEREVEVGRAVMRSKAGPVDLEMVRASTLFRMIGHPGRAHFILGCPLFPRAVYWRSCLREYGVRNSATAAAGRSCCNSQSLTSIHRLRPSASSLPHPVRQPQCPRALVTTLSSFDGPSSVLAAGGTKIASAKQQTSQRCSRFPRRVGTLNSPVSPVSLLTGQRGLDDISVVGFALGHVGGPLREEVHSVSLA